MKDRIIQIMEKEGITAGKFAQQIGTQPSVISHIINGRNKPSMEIIQKILSSFPTINPDWLILGVGSMHRSSTPAQTTLFTDVMSHDVAPPAENKEKSSKRTTSKETEDIHIVGEVHQKIDKKIKKITVYFSDMTFEEFVPSDQ